MMKQSKAEVDTDDSANQNTALTIEDKELKTEIIQKLTEKKVEIDNYNNGKNILFVKSENDLINATSFIFNCQTHSVLYFKWPSL